METNFKVAPALVLDLDGTVRYSASDPEGFISGPDDVAIYPDVEERLWYFKDEGYLVFGVSNQGGVAFGHKSLVDAYREVYRMRGTFGKDPFDHVIICPFMPGGNAEPFNRGSLYRKPSVGMLAILEYYAFELDDQETVIDWSRSIVVGDREEDYEMAHDAERLVRGIEFRSAEQFFRR